MKRGRIRIGTSGWHYPNWVGPFYPKTLSSDHFLSYYAQQLTSVEINNTFYRLPAIHTLMDWHNETPKDFLFACKASQYITYIKKLKDPEQTIKRFFQNIERLGNKLGPILFQLPPGWHINVERLGTFIEALPKTYRFAFEFRDKSWFAQPVYEVLTKHNAAFCLYNLGGRWSPKEVTADFVYIRLHGPGDPYKGRYPATMLRSWGNTCLHWANTGKDGYCFFDNDEQAYATSNALSLNHQVMRHYRSPAPLHQMRGK